MTDVKIRPDLRTSGGEVNDILIHDRYAGTLTLVYREGERMSGSVQLEKESLSPRDKEEVIRHTRMYVQALIDAYHVSDCDVVVTYSTYDHVIVTDNNLGVIEEMILDDDDGMEDDNAEYITDSPNTLVEDEDLDNLQLKNQRQRYLKRAALPPRNTAPRNRFEPEQASDSMVYYELVIVGEARDSVEYHVYDGNKRWVAEAYMTIYDTDVIGDVHWRYHPADEDIEHVTDLIISDFDEDEIETFSIDMKYEEQTIETIELTHQSLQQEMDVVINGGTDSDYTAVLVRDDGDTLTYEVYNQRRGGLPICTATVDITTWNVTGFVEFHHSLDEEEREAIATSLLMELDKERDYDSLNLSMLHNNELIEEVLFEMDQVH